MLLQLFPPFLPFSTSTQPHILSSLSRSPFCCLCPWVVHTCSLVNPFFVSSPKSNRYAICNESCSHVYLSLSISFQTFVFSNLSALLGILILTVTSDPLQSAPCAFFPPCVPPFNFLRKGEILLFTVEGIFF